jgi:hypothetical protein
VCWGRAFCQCKFPYHCWRYKPTIHSLKMTLVVNCKSTSLSVGGANGFSRVSNQVYVCISKISNALEHTFTCESHENNHFLMFTLVALFWINGSSVLDTALSVCLCVCESPPSVKVWMPKLVFMKLGMLPWYLSPSESRTSLSLSHHFVRVRVQQ